MLHYEGLMDYSELLYKIYGSPEEIKETFFKEASNWEYHPVYKDGQVIALFMTYEDQIHCGCLPEYKKKWFPMKKFKKIIKDILKIYGKATTSTFENTRNFVERLGFKEVEKINDVIYYIKTEE